MSFYSVRHPDKKPIQNIFEGVKIERGKIMGGLMGRYDGDEKVAYTAAVAKSADLVTQLKERIQYYSLEIDKAKEMLVLLERNPDFEKMINLSRGLI